MSEFHKRQVHLRTNKAQQCTDEWAVDDSREAERVAGFYYNIQIKKSLIVWESWSSSEDEE